jgi:hypothetical protein
MSFQPIIRSIWEKKEEIIENGTYIKLTLAKTIGDTELKTSMYVRYYWRMMFSVFPLALSIKRKLRHTIDETFSWFDTVFE